MNKRTVIPALVVLAAAVLFPAASALAQTPKLAVINSQLAFQNSAEGKRAATQFQAREDKIKSDLARLDNEIRGLESRLTTQRMTLSNEALLQLQGDIERKTTDRKRTEEDAARDMQQLQMNLIQKIRNEMITIINQLAAERGYDIVLDVAASGIVYHSQPIDITDEIVRRYDASKASGAPAKK
ncbi:MAG: OmpH family outer membrane protein [Candidatus Aminicenantes bacterium]|nr:OmpH family outer membrane protein [Candidatus Aminicenantes bacterium]